MTGSSGEGLSRGVVVNFGNPVLSGLISPSRFSMGDSDQGGPSVSGLGDILYPLTGDLETVVLAPKGVPVHSY